MRPTSAQARGAPRIGMQLWSVNAAMQADPANALRVLKHIGYTEVEAAGFGRLSAHAFRSLLDDLGLSCPSAHLDFTGDVDAALEQGCTVGARYVVSSMLPPLSATRLTVADAERTAELANRIGERARQAGLQYAYHNHAFELQRTPQGPVPFDILLRRTDPALVKFELDCGWMQAANYDPIEYFRRFPGRFPLIHIKDFAPAVADEPAANRRGIELGRGFIDYKPILDAARAAGVEHFLVEQEGPFDRMSELDAARVNYEHLRTLWN